jgi:hypothetical protein|tara:strand:- start:61 stop:675 length:615 start_codon:yes stop_codon:yes gene_type:complete
MSNINFFRVLQSGGVSNPAPSGTVRTILFVAALTETTGAWSNVTSTSVTNASNTGWDACASPSSNGLPNSNAIISQSGHTNSAAKYCLDFSSGGYSDWYLGTNTEVLWMSDTYLDSTVQNIITNAGGTAVGSGYYWSSLQDGTTASRAFIGRYNATSATTKGSTLAIRPQKTLVLSPTGQYSVGSLAFGGIVFKMSQLTYGNIC